jgi:hypothetical protein
MKDFNYFKKTLSKIDGYIYALCEIKGDKRIPFYIGKGKGDRCLQHLKEDLSSEKAKKINLLLDSDSLGIDIIRHGIKDETVLKLIEATCIDLIGVGDLTNIIRGHGTEMGRMTLEEIDSIVSRNLVVVNKEHSGLAFLLNDTYKSGMSALSLFESTRGVWSNPPKNDSSIKYAYATYNGIVKEVYEIYEWVKAGTQLYFTRTFEDRDISKRWEFIGHFADDEIRKMYNGKLIEKERSYGSPFVKVGRK